jgi:hypothetical protein
MIWRCATPWKKGREGSDQEDFRQHQYRHVSPGCDVQAAGGCTLEIVRCACPGPKHCGADAAVGAGSHAGGAMSHVGHTLEVTLIVRRSVIGRGNHQRGRRALIGLRPRRGDGGKNEKAERKGQKKLHGVPVTPQSYCRPGPTVKEIFTSLRPAELLLSRLQEDSWAGRRRRHSEFGRGGRQKQPCLHACSLLCPGRQPGWSVIREIPVVEPRPLHRYGWSRSQREGEAHSQFLPPASWSPRSSDNLRM